MEKLTIQQLTPEYIKHCKDISPIIYIDEEGNEVTEIFKPIKDYEDYYVSSLGRVFSKKRTWKSGVGVTVKKECMLTLSITDKGYLAVGLTANKRSRTISVSRLVCTEFNDNPENKPQVNHIDGVKWNNRADNLEWSTAGENMRHAWNMGLKQKHRSFQELQAKMISFNPFISHCVGVATPKGKGRIIMHQNCYRVEYDNMGYENLIKCVRFYGNEVKLHLWNIDCLTKTIQHEGREFIPLLELAKIAFPDNDWYFNPQIKEACCRKYEGYWFGYNSDLSCFTSGNWDETQSHTPNQYQLFQKLAEWHIDFLGLIEKGLAIDKNTLK